MIGYGHGVEVPACTSSWRLRHHDHRYRTTLQACDRFFMDDLRGRLANRVQLTSDGHRPYLEAVEEAFGFDIDYAMLVKVYGAAPEGQRRYSP